MTTYEHLQLEGPDEDGIAVLTICREAALNALNRATMAELGHFFREKAPAWPSLTGIIVTGAGQKAFVAGADIKEFLSLDAEGAAAMSREGQSVFFAIERFPRPVVAAVNGFALGGGCELAMACHLRIAAENARFGQPEVNLGLIPGYGGTQRLVRYAGKGKALEWMLTGDMVSAAEARELGLVNQVVPVGTAVESARALLRKIGEKGPVAVTEVIKAVNAYFDPGTDGYEQEVLSFGKAAGTADFQEGAQAFIEKRKARFTGR
ncbi:MAG: hypothetical protein RLY31_2711 [Bacteroidota bacterium]|jgi:enoyl-CoA hydratase